jgi:hypothetical protein
MRITFLFLMVTVLMQIQLQAQDVLYKPDVLPHSPEAAAFAKNINIPVSYSSGTPQISIPFYTATSGNVKLPISISYNASGIRVEEVATWVGLGWSLSAGGQITRVVRGLPDESGIYGYLHPPSNRTVRYVDSAHCRCISGSTETSAIQTDLNNGILDLEPDQYSFSVIGYSGDFYWNQDSSKYILVPFQNIKVLGAPGDFTLVLPDGNSCHFGGGDSYQETLLSGTTSSYIDGYSQAAQAISNTPQATSWMLSSITEPSGRTITFDYRSETVINFGRGGERWGKSLTDGTETNRRQSFYKQYIKKPMIQKISADNVNVYFKPSASHRVDVPDYFDGSRSLDTILVTNKSDKELRSFYFHYGYFVSPSYSTSNILDIGVYSNEAQHRLYLSSITEKYAIDSLPPYVFTYNSVELPSRFSTSQDYWGYYNGKSNGLLLMPKIPQNSFNPVIPNYNEDNSVLPSSTYFNNDGADRRIDTSLSAARILNKIQYPTGGTIEYSYEQNKASTDYIDMYGGVTPPDMVDQSYSLNTMSVLLPASPPYPLYYSGNFTINVPATKVKVTPVLPTCASYSTSSCIYTVNIKRLPDSALMTTFNTTNVFDIQLNKGQYLLEILVNDSPDNYPQTFNVTCNWGERLDSTSFLVGGVRVRRIVERNGMGKTLNRTLRYTYDGSARSSGIVEGYPTYKVYDINTQLQPVRRYYSSNSTLPLTADGKTVRYEFVSEYLDSVASALKTTYTFNNGVHVPFKFAAALTGAPQTSYAFENNFLKRKQIFERSTSGTYRVLTDEQHYFRVFNALNYLYGLYGPQIISYSLATEWYVPDSTGITNYSYLNDQKDSLYTGEKYFYNERILKSITRIQNSKGKLTDKKTWYPSDYNDVSGYNISTLLSKNIIELPVKVETSVNGKITGGSINSFNSNGQPLDGYNYENASLIDTSVHNKSIVLESNYILKGSLRYDADGNLKQINNSKAPPSTFIWDYAINGFTGLKMNLYPIAEVTNADSSSVAYTSFENASTGNWSYSGGVYSGAGVMGKKVYDLSAGPVSKSGLNSSSSYIVSYWSSSQKSVTNTNTVTVGSTYNGWTYYEHQVANPSSGTISVSGSGQIDELRLYPKGALMKTYGYDDKYQLNASSDINNHIIYYVYDGFDRLNLIRDENGYILKKFCYNYAGQPENCGLGTDAQWQVTNAVCEQVNGVYTGTKIKTEKDTNPNSSTYNQTRTITVPNGCWVCTSSNCTGEGNKCVNNLCEAGVKISDGSVRSGRNSYCYYHYQWSDGSTSQSYSVIVPLSDPCPIN